MSAKEETSKQEQRYEAITRNLQEILGDAELRKILEEGRTPRIYWGTATTGRPHVAYILPMLKIADFLRAGCPVTILLADLHAVLDNLKAPMDLVGLRAEYYELVVKAILSGIGADLGRIRFVRGSDFQLERKYTLDVHRLATMTTVHDAQRAGAQVVKQTGNPFLSGLTYPGMQALDEEYLEVDAQFGGADQRKIFIYAEKFLPLLGYRKRIHLMNPMVPGLGAGKMSSSDEQSKIDLLDSDAAIRKKVSKAFCEEGNIEANGVLSFARFLVLPVLEGRAAPLEVAVYKKGAGEGREGGEAEVLEYWKYSDLEKDFQSKRIHPGDLKQAVARHLVEIVAPIREALLQHSDLIARAYPYPPKAKAKAGKAGTE